MDSQSRDVVTFLLLTAVTLGGIIAAATRLILVPYLRDHLVIPVRETHTQVTQNSHSEPHPTLPDRLEDLHTDVRTLTRLLDLHVSWSLEEHNDIRNELENYRAKEEQERGTDHDQTT